MQSNQVHGRYAQVGDTGLEGNVIGNKVSMAADVGIDAIGGQVEKGGDGGSCNSDDYSVEGVRMEDTFTPSRESDLFTDEQQHCGEGAGRLEDMLTGYATVRVKKSKAVAASNRSSDASDELAAVNEIKREVKMHAMEFASRIAAKRELPSLLAKRADGAACSTLSFRPLSKQRQGDQRAEVDRDSKERKDAKNADSGYIDDRGSDSVSMYGSGSWKELTGKDESTTVSFPALDAAMAGYTAVGFMGLRRDGEAEQQLPQQRHVGAAKSDHAYTMPVQQQSRLTNRAVHPDGEGKEASSSMLREEEADGTCNDWSHPVSTTAMDDGCARALVPVLDAVDADFTDCVGSGFVGGREGCTTEEEELQLQLESATSKNKDDEQAAGVRDPYCGGDDGVGSGRNKDHVTTGRNAAGAVQTAVALAPDNGREDTEEKRKQFHAGPSGSTSRYLPSALTNGVLNSDGKGKKASSKLSEELVDTTCDLSHHDARRALVPSFNDSVAENTAPVSGLRPVEDWRNEAEASHLINASASYRGNRHQSPAKQPVYCADMKSAAPCGSDSVEEMAETCAYSAYGDFTRPLMPSLGTVDDDATNFGRPDLLRDRRNEAEASHLINATPCEERAETSAYSAYGDFTRPLISSLDDVDGDVTNLGRPDLLRDRRNEAKSSQSTVASESSGGDRHLFSTRHPANCAEKKSATPRTPESAEDRAGTRTYSGYDDFTQGRVPLLDAVNAGHTGCGRPDVVRDGRNGAQACQSTSASESFRGDHRPSSTGQPVYCTEKKSDAPCASDCEDRTETHAYSGNHDFTRGLLPSLDAVDAGLTNVVYSDFVRDSERSEHGYAKPLHEESSRHACEELVECSRRPNSSSNADLAKGALLQVSHGGNTAENPSSYSVGKQDFSTMTAHVRGQTVNGTVANSCTPEEQSRVRNEGLSAFLSRLDGTGAVMRESNSTTKLTGGALPSSDRDETSSSPEKKNAASDKAFSFSDDRGLGHETSSAFVDRLDGTSLAKWGTDSAINLTGRALLSLGGDEYLRSPERENAASYHTSGFSDGGGFTMAFSPSLDGVLADYNARCTGLSTGLATLGDQEDDPPGCCARNTLRRSDDPQGGPLDSRTLDCSQAGNNQKWKNGDIAEPSGTVSSEQGKVAQSDVEGLNIGVVSSQAEENMSDSQPKPEGDTVSSVPLSIDAVGPSTTGICAESAQEPRPATGGAGGSNSVNPLLGLSMPRSLSGVPSQLQSHGGATHALTMTNETSEEPDALPQNITPESAREVESAADLSSDREVEFTTENNLGKSVQESCRGNHADAAAANYVSFDVMGKSTLLGSSEAAGIMRSVLECGDDYRRTTPAGSSKCSGGLGDVQRLENGSGGHSFLEAGHVKDISQQETICGNVLSPTVATDSAVRQAPRESARDSASDPVELLRGQGDDVTAMSMHGGGNLHVQYGSVYSEQKTADPGTHRDTGSTPLSGEVQMLQAAMSALKSGSLSRKRPVASFGEVRVENHENAPKVSIPEVTM
ncbi:hypothetical protein CBR_g51958 [Chara braunii]|uniref:Uncharacterized protein n=1 Tax=Chara braunii TaxID=69332 RepID=A0A388K6H8_CHABU|nr:hypothetical protein CBR_g51958 [Chara braunii]|eukprot:GBG65658.1 hypothetical protein CBR_g51958 [Chara braunii]